MGCLVCRTEDGLYIGLSSFFTRESSLLPSKGSSLRKRAFLLYLNSALWPWRCTRKKKRRKGLSSLLNPSSYTMQVGATLPLPPRVTLDVSTGHKKKCTRYTAFDKKGGAPLQYQGGSKAVVSQGSGDRTCCFATMHLCVKKDCKAEEQKRSLYAPLPPPPPL